MSYMRTTLLAIFFCFFLLGLIASPALPRIKAFYSPVIQVDSEHHRVLISTFGSVFWIDVPEAANRTSRNSGVRSRGFRRRDERERTSAPTEDLESEIGRDKLHMLRWENLSLVPFARLVLRQYLFQGLHEGHHLRSRSVGGTLKASRVALACPKMPSNRLR